MSKDDVNSNTIFQEKHVTQATQWKNKGTKLPFKFRGYHVISVTSFTLRRKSRCSISQPLNSIRNHRLRVSWFISGRWVTIWFIITRLVYELFLLFITLFTHFSTILAHTSLPFAQTPSPNNHSFPPSYIKSPSISLLMEILVFFARAVHCLVAWKAAAAMMELKRVSERKHVGRRVFENEYNAAPFWSTVSGLLLV